MIDEATLQKIKEVLAKNNQIAIAVGKNPSLDAMGAALALYLSLNDSGKNVFVACPTEPIVELSSLVKINKVKTSLNGESGDLTVSFPYREGEIEKVSYTLEDGYLNIVVKAGKDGLSFSEKDVKFGKGNVAFSGLLFIVGTPRLSDLENLFNPEALRDTTVINIDNKADNQGFGDIVLVSRQCSSVSEIMTNFISSLGLKLDLDTAQNLLLGIASATENFQDIKTSPLAFEMTSLLLKRGAVRPKSSKDQTPIARDNSFFPPLIKTAPKQVSSQDKPKPIETPPDWLTPKIYKGSTEI